jgi:hypothetical protein
LGGRTVDEPPVGASIAIEFGMLNVLPQLRGYLIDLEPRVGGRHGEHNSREENCSIVIPNGEMVPGFHRPDEAIGSDTRNAFTLPAGMDSRYTLDNRNHDKNRY